MLHCEKEVLKLLKYKPFSVKFLCLVPTRELAQQVGHVAERFARPLYKRTAIVYGGAMKGGQLRQLQRGLLPILLSEFIRDGSV